ncbi:MAG: hypothetical protein H8E26_02460 [FCB group bacterium]|nr:hypothetical protein [FCB group bacterium]MBL7027395.1 hypothetical protein [Candidatus Neomarinimicrobiota bacterium]MBL7122654.1 hypothetical protein [Candidatus Neomarinimicrobiota bacterium]
MKKLFGLIMIVFAITFFGPGEFPFYLIAGAGFIIVMQKSIKSGADNETQHVDKV